MNGIFSENYEELMEGFLAEIKNNKSHETKAFRLLYSIWEIYSDLGMNFLFDEILAEDELFDYLWDRYYNPDVNYHSDWWMKVLES